jgi:hypothetical protein
MFYTNADSFLLQIGKLTFEPLSLSKEREYNNQKIKA